MNKQIEHTDDCISEYAEYSECVRIYGSAWVEWSCTCGKPEETPEQIAARHREEEELERWLYRR